MFRVLILQDIYNLSDDAINYQIRDLLSFMRFLGLQLNSRGGSRWHLGRSLRKLHLRPLVRQAWNENLGNCRKGRNL